jgi:hypothetical protein
MKLKRLSSFPNLPHRKRSFLFGPGEQILDHIETIRYQQDKIGNDTKTFRFCFQNDIGTFVLSFITSTCPEFDFFVFLIHCCGTVNI